ncbi:MAG: ANTAR domain-containing protein, partial [Dermatophilaceae bacterium]
CSRRGDLEMTTVEPSKPDARQAIPDGAAHHARTTPPASPDDAQVRGLVVEVAQLKAALASRAEIGQAVGILMARHGCGAEEAFATLRKTSNDTNVRLADLAATIMGDTSRAPSERHHIGDGRDGDVTGCRPGST